MNIAQEFFKVRHSFGKVKEDMNFISNKISENYDEFMKEHKKLASEVEILTNEIKNNLTKIKQVHLTDTSSYNEKEVHDLKSEMKLLKKEIIEIQKDHSNFASSIEKVSKNKKEIKSLKDKLHSSELELFLLKDKLAEKDVEIKQIKEISRHLYDVVDELSKTELDLVNLTNKSEIGSL